MTISRTDNREMTRQQLSAALIGTGRKLSAIVKEINLLRLSHKDAEEVVTDWDRLNEMLQTAHQMIFSLACEHQLCGVMDGETTAAA